jgi:hypothetical protein
VLRLLHVLPVTRKDEYNLSSVPRLRVYNSLRAFAENDDNGDQSLFYLALSKQHNPESM